MAGTVFFLYLITNILVCTIMCVCVEALGGGSSLKPGISFFW